MRISEIFDLRRSQHELDFVDLDISTDTPLFLEPYYLRQSRDPWCQDASQTIGDYTRVLLSRLKESDEDVASELLSYLSEPNETCLGLSVAEPQGRGFSGRQVEQLIDRIIKSKAIAKGLVTDLEDFRVLVPRIGPDKMSDIVTNVVRGHLIEYTQKQCDLLRIELEPNQISGPLWNREKHEWVSLQTDLLVHEGRQILLVPKTAVSLAKAYTRDRYHRQFVVPVLITDHKRRRTPLVQVRRYKSGKRKEIVRVQDVIEHEKSNRIDFIINFTARHPKVFRDFKRSVPDRHVDPLLSGEIARKADNPPDERTSVPAVAEHLIEELQAIRPGPDDAHAFHDIAHALLEFVFYPRLCNPEKEHEIEEGDKRIDITFDNAARSGFFEQLYTADRLAASFLIFECKNYVRDPRNPEFDQLAGRLSPNTTEVGFLVCRQVEDMDDLLRRCHHAYVARRGLMIPIDDRDMIRMLRERGGGSTAAGEEFLFQRRRRIMFG